MNIFFTVVWRDLRLAMRRKAEVLNSVFFFVVVAALFPLAIGPEPEMLRHIGPAARDAAPECVTRLVDALAKPTLRVSAIQALGAVTAADIADCLEPALAELL